MRQILRAWFVLIILGVSTLHAQAPLFPPRYKSAELPDARAGNYGLVFVTDSSKGTCDQADGGGTFRVLCLDTGASWSPIARADQQTWKPPYDALEISFDTDGTIYLAPAITGPHSMVPTDDGRSCRGGAAICSESFCSSTCPCPLGSGDCDSDAECLGDLVCRSATLSEVQPYCSSVPTNFGVCDVP